MEVNNSLLVYEQTPPIDIADDENCPIASNPTCCNIKADMQYVLHDICNQSVFQAEFISRVYETYISPTPSMALVPQC